MDEHVESICNVGLGLTNSGIIVFNMCKIKLDVDGRHKVYY